MSEVVLKKVSYGQLYENTWLVDDDRYGIAAFVDENVRRTFLQSPNNNNPEKTAVLLALDGGIIVGRHLLYGTKIRVGGATIKAQSSGCTEVHESQRGKGIGSKINKWTLNNDEYPLYICSLLSPACLHIMEKKENACTIIKFPELIKIINIKSAFVCRGIRGRALKLCKGISDIFLWAVNIPAYAKLAKLIKKYYVKKEDDIPIWAEDMCMNDGHKYAELHDNAWLRWNLNHNLTGKPQDKQSFYSIYKGNVPVGFFFTKERLRDDVSSEMIIGTICEWATTDNELTEADINLLAFDTFDRNCYYIRTITNNPKIVKKLRKLGYVRHGEMQMGFKDKLGQFPDMVDQSNWRIRFGCCNSILY